MAANTGESPRQMWRSGAADAAHRDLDHDSVRLGVRHIELPDLVALARAEEDGGLTLLCHSALILPFRDVRVAGGDAVYLASKRGICQVI